MLPSDAPPSLGPLLRRWQKIAEARPPQPGDFPFDGLVRDHPGLGLIEPAVSPEGRSDYRYRRVGPAHKLRTGRSLEGKLFRDVLHAASIPRVLQIYDEILAQGQPHYWESINLVHGAKPVAYGRLVLPLFGEDGTVSHLLGCWVWRDEATP